MLSARSLGKTYLSGTQRLQVLRDVTLDGFEPAVVFRRLLKSGKR